MTLHALQRLKERYNLNLNFDDLVTIIKAIKNDYGVIIKMSGVQMTLWVLYGHCPIRLVYDTLSENIVTVLPFDVDEYNKLPKLENISSIKEKNRLLDFEKNLLEQKFKSRHKEEMLKQNLNIITSIIEKCHLRIYTKSEKFILIGKKLPETNSIEYAVYNIENLKVRLNKSYKRLLKRKKTKTSKTVQKYLKRLEKY